MKTYKFIDSDKIEQNLTYSELFTYFNGTFNETGRKIMPLTAKRIIKVTKQGGVVTLAAKKVVKKAVKKTVKNDNFIIKAKNVKLYVKKAIFTIFRSTRFESDAAVFNKHYANKYLNILNKSDNFQFVLIKI